MNNISIGQIIAILCLTAAQAKSVHETIDQPPTGIAANRQAPNNYFGLLNEFLFNRK